MLSQRLRSLWPRMMMLPVGRMGMSWTERASHRPGESYLLSMGNLQILDWSILAFGARLINIKKIQWFCFFGMKSLVDIAWATPRIASYLIPDQIICGGLCSQQEVRRPAPQHCQHFEDGWWNQNWKHVYWLGCLGDGDECPQSGMEYNHAWATFGGLGFGLIYLLTSAESSKHVKLVLNWGIPKINDLPGVLEDWHTMINILRFLDTMFPNNMIVETPGRKSVFHDHDAHDDIFSNLELGLLFALVALTFNDVKSSYHWKIIKHTIPVHTHTTRLVPPITLVWLPSHPMCRRS